MGKIFLSKLLNKSKTIGNDYDPPIKTFLHTRTLRNLVPAKKENNGKTFSE